MLKNILLSLVMILSSQNLLLAQDIFDPNLYIVDDFDINAPDQHAPANHEELLHDGMWGFEETLDLRADDYKLPNVFSRSLPDNVAAKVFSLRVKSKKCDQTAYITVSYPTNLINDNVEKYFRTISEELYDSAIEEVKVKLDESSQDSDNCDDIFPKVMIFQSSFKILATDGGIISLVFFGNYAPGGAHPDSFVRADNINVKTIKDVTLTDVFPNTKSSLRKLWPYLANIYCSKEASQGSLPEFFGGTKCRATGFNQDSPLPKVWTEEHLYFTSLGDAVYLSPEGLHITLESYSAWGYIYGSVEALIPKYAAIAMGASPAIWFK
jgi:hypothetical protein